MLVAIGPQAVREKGGRRRWCSSSRGRGSEGLERGVSGGFREHGAIPAKGP